MAGGATIDHIMAVTVLLTAMLLAMMTFNGLFAQALEYDTNRQVANKAVDIMNTICLSPGSPAPWGETDDPVLGFGLQDPDASGYTLSPYSLMRLNTTSNDSPPVYFDVNGLYYSNLSTSYGNAMLNPLGDCLNYTTVSELLGIKGTYGFSLDVAPTIDVNVTQVGTNPLTLNVEVMGSGLPLTDASLTCHLLKVETSGTEPSVELFPPEYAVTGYSGSVNVVYSSVIDVDPVYSFTVYVSLGGVTGVGYYTHDGAGADDEVFIVPLIEDYNQGDLILAHSYNFIPGPNSVLKYNASFFVLTSDFTLQEVDLNCDGHLNYGAGFPGYVTASIPASEVGFLVISYVEDSNVMGSVIIPWGIGTLGVSASFGGQFGSDGYDFVATELRQVTINDISYQVKVTAWKLGN